MKATVLTVLYTISCIGLVIHIISSNIVAGYIGYSASLVASVWQICRLLALYRKKRNSTHIDR